MTYKNAFFLQGSGLELTGFPQGALSEMGFEKLNLTRTVPSERIIAGADCSGSKEVPNETWIAVGTLTGAGLEITQVSKIGMHTLGTELSKIQNLTAAGLDFPFSLPREFLDFLSEKAERSSFQEWQEVVEHLIFMPLEVFQEHIQRFKKEPKRYTDKITLVPGLSPLHKGYPAMVQMTWHGMRTLASLNPEKFCVLPFQDVAAGKCSLLEVYPRTVLKCLGLPDTGYKSKDKKDKDKMQSARHKLLQGLISAKERTRNSAPKLVLPQKLEHLVVDSDHAFDALVACYATAMHAHDAGVFADPFSCDSVDVLIEGWIYEPCKLPAAV